MRDAIVDIDVIRDAVALACRAPSLHNSQPWRFVSRGSTVDLFLDAAPAPKYTDPTGRELLISCGAVLDHFRGAMAAAGWRANVDRFPNPNYRDHLASIDFTPVDFVTDAHLDRARAILRRHTDRLPFTAPPDWNDFIAELTDPLVASGVHLHLVPDELHGELARASKLVRAIRRYDSLYHAELLGWTADVVVAEGIPTATLLSPTESERVDIGRDFPSSGDHDRRSTVQTDHARVVVLSTEEATREDAVACGERLSSLLLDATLAGFATCTLSHLTEIPASRDIVAAVTDAALIPQVLVRVGCAPSLARPGPLTPRRRVDDVLQRET